MEKSLQKSEWVFLVAIIALIVILFSVSKFTSYRSLELLDQRRKKEEIQIEVEISGHVKRPGRYQISRGQSLNEILSKARPKALADLTMFDRDKSLDESCSIHIQPLKIVKIRVEGCVKENISLEMPAGSRICHLKGQIELSSDADRSFLRRRRILKEGEILVIPSLSK